MAETRITNVVVPEVFTAYTLEPSIYRSRFYRSGILQENGAISALLNGGGETFQLPFWQDVSGTSGDIPVEGSDVTINNITASKQIARRQFREKAWGTNNLATVLSGDDPLAAVQNYVNDYWAQAWDLVAMAALEGVIADNVANDSGDLVNDVSGGVGSAAYFSDDAVIDAQGLLGENGVIGRSDSSDYVAIMVHPSTYAYMRKQDLIDEIPISGQERPVPFYMNMQVIVDRNATFSTPVYSSYIFKAGCFQYGIGTSGYIPTETDRAPKTGFGEDQLFTRRVVSIHPVGTAWQEASVAGTSPTDVELATASNWNRVFNKENMRVVVLKHKLP